MRAKLRVHILVTALALGAASACGSGGQSPTTPTPARADLAISGLTVEPARFGNGFAYSLRMSLTNTGQAAASIQSVTYGIVVGGATTKSASAGALAVFPASSVAPGAALTSLTPVIFVDETPQAYATSILATVSFQDSLGTNTVTRSVPVPALQ